MSIDKKLSEIFVLFQDKDRNEVYVKDIPTIIRYLGFVPNEAEMQKTVSAMVGEESSDTVHLAAFLTVAKKLVQEKRFLGGHKTELKKAMMVLAKECQNYLEELEPPEEESVGLYGDTKKKHRPPGCMTRDELVKILSCEGEPLTSEEAEEMIISLPMQDKEFIDVELYSSQLVAIPKFY